MKRKKRTRRGLSWLLAVAVIMTTVFAGGMPVLAEGTAADTNMLSEISFSSDPYEEGEPVKLISEVDPETKECTVGVVEESGTLGICAVLKEEAAGATIEAKYQNIYNDSVTTAMTSGEELLLDNLVEYGGIKGGEVHITVTLDDKIEEYTVHVVRLTPLMEILVKDGDNSYLTGFDGSKTEYEITVPGGTESVEVSLVAMVWGDIDNNVYTVNGEPAVLEDGAFYATRQVPLTEEKTTIVAKAEKEGTVGKEYTLNIIKDIKKVDLTVTTNPADATVTITDDAGAAVQGTDGVYSLEAGKDYNYTIEREGFVTQTGTVNLTDSETKNFTLESAEAPLLLKGIEGYQAQNVVFDVLTKEATLVYDTSTNVQLRVKLHQGTTDKDMKVVYTYTDSAGKDVNVESTAKNQYESMAGAIKDDGTPNDITITATKGGVTEVYTVHIKQLTILTGLQLNYENGDTLKFDPAFKKTTTEYRAKVLSDVNAVNITVKNPAAGNSKVMVNGTEVTGSTYKMDLVNGENKAVIKVEKGAAEQTSYTVIIDRVQKVELSVQVNPKDALFTIYDEENERIWPENGKYNLFPGDDYSYAVTKLGYVGQSGILNISQSETKEFELKKAAEITLPELDADYPGFRSGRDNMSVVDAKTPITPDSIEVKWERQTGEYVKPTSGTTPIIVDNKVYTLSGNKLYVLDKETGEILKTSETVTPTTFGLMPPTYAEGMLFVPLGNGTIQCFNAETLESLWVYEDPAGGRSESAIRYDDGYIYVGFFTTKKSGFVCISVTDEDPSQQTERKAATWRDDTLGSFYWDGCWTNENYVILCTNNGVLNCIDKMTGEIKQQVDLGEQVRCDVSYYNGRIYVASQKGKVHSYNLKEDGTLDTENLINPLPIGVQSTSTPAIYNNRLYVGINGGEMFGVEGNAILVADIDPKTGAMTPAYAVPTDGYCQTSGLIITGYEKEDGYVYVYFLANSAHGQLYMIKDKAGLKEADPASGLFYTPTHEQYCIASAVADSDGNLYLKNDSAWQFVLKRSDVYLTEVNIDGGNGIIDGGKPFDGSINSHTIQVDPGTESFKLDLTANEGTEVMINGVPGSMQDIKLVDGRAEIEVQLKKGGTVRTFTFHVVTGPVVKEIRIDNSPNEGMASAAYSLDPAFDPMTTEYTAGVDKVMSDAYIWPTLMSSKDKMTMTVISGVYNKNEGDEIKGSTNYKGNTYFNVSFADRENPTIAKVKLTVASEDGTQSKDYTFTLFTQNALPIITTDDGAVSERTDNSAKINMTSNKAAELYYLVQAADAAAPDSAKIIAEGTKADVVEGKNTIEVTGLQRNAQKLYMVLKDASGAESAVRILDIASVIISGDMNGDGKLTNLDVSMLLNKVTANEDVDLETGDINGDGKISNLDVSMLLNKVTAGNN